jgi:inner membrane transporter RhtA
VLALTSQQGGAAIAVLLSDYVSPLMASALSIGAGALSLVLWVGRRYIRSVPRRVYARLRAFLARRRERLTHLLSRIKGLGTAMLLMVAALAIGNAISNASYLYAAQKLPLGTTAALSFLGPLGVSVVKSFRAGTGFRRFTALLWPVLAGGGVFFLTNPLQGPIDGWGVLFALISAACWANFLIIMGHITQESRHAAHGEKVVAAATTLSAIVLFTSALIFMSDDWADTHVLVVAMASGLFGSGVPQLLQVATLRRVSQSTNGVLLGLEPAISSLIGLIALSQRLSLLEMLGIALVCAAGAGASRGESRSTTSPTRR